MRWSRSTRRSRARPAGAEDDDVLDALPAGAMIVAPLPRRVGRADDDDAVADLDRLVAARDDNRVAADDARDLRVGRDRGLSQRHADHAGPSSIVELDDLHLAVGEDVGLPRRRHADDPRDGERRLALGRDDEVDVELALLPDLEVLLVRRAHDGLRLRRELLREDRAMRLISSREVQAISRSASSTPASLSVRRLAPFPARPPTS